MGKIICCKISQIGVFFFLFIILTGCSVRHGDFTVISNKLVRLSNLKLDDPDRRKNVEGEDMKRIIVYFSTGIPTIEGALDDAFAKGDGDVMTDAVIEYKWFYIPYIYGEQSWNVKGDVIKTRK